MKKFQKMLLVMACAMLVSLVPATRVEAAEGRPGQTISVTFSFNDIRGVDGTFQFSNRELFSSVSYSSSFSGTRFNNDKVFYSTTEAGTSSGTITVTATIRPGASVGDSCTITLANINLTDANTESVYSGSRSEVVTVASAQTTVDNQNQGNNQNQTQNYNSSTTKKPTTSSGVSAIDYTELKKQVEIANGIKSDGYTKASWEAFSKALTDARDALNSDNQEAVDKAATALKSASEHLKKMDYSKLEAAIKDANSLMDNEEIANLMKQLIVAVNNGTLLLSSVDQEEVDAATSEIVDLTKLIESVLAEALEAEDTKADTVEPQNDYCNITIHKVWPILFFISLAINGVLVFLIITGVRLRRKPGEDTPLVDYDIDDDSMDEEFEWDFDSDDSEVEESDENKMDAE